MADRTAAIAAAILAHAETMSIGSPVLPVHWAGIAVKHPSQGKYIWIEYLPNPTTVPAIDDDSSLVHAGLLQCSVYWPNGVGIVAPLTAAGEVVAHFPRSTRLYGTGFHVRFRRGWASSVLQEAAWMHVPVSIDWQAVAS